MWEFSLAKSNQKKTDLYQEWAELLLGVMQPHVDFLKNLGKFMKILDHIILISDHFQSKEKYLGPVSGSNK